MHIVVVAACSQDGFITDEHGSLPSTWTSEEDLTHFKAILKKFPLQVMGRKTYEAHLPKPEIDTLKVILTSRPKKYASEAKVGELEFHCFTAKEFIQHFNIYERCLVLGGKDIYTDFVNSGMVNEAYITIEPVILGGGVEFLTHGKTLENYGFRRVSSKQMNAAGTLLNHYVLIK